MRSNLALSRFLNFRSVLKPKSTTVFSEKDFNICAFQQPGNPEKVATESRLDDRFKGPLTDFARC